MLELKEGMDVSKLRFRRDKVNSMREILAVYSNNNDTYPFAVVYREDGLVNYDEYTLCGSFIYCNDNHWFDIIEVGNATT